MENSVIEAILKNGGDKLTKPLKGFIRYFYAYVSCDYESKSGILLCIARDLFEYVKTRKLRENRVRVFRPTVKSHGWQSAFTVVEIVTEDKPFLVDSVTGELKNRGYVIRERINSVIPRKINDKNILESVIYFSITSICEKDMHELESTLTIILKMVECCVDDWKQMLNKVDEISNTIQGNEYIVEKERLEIVDFLQWLKQGNFVFLGYAQYNWEEQDGRITRDDRTLLGVPKIDKAVYDVDIRSGEEHTIFITRSNRFSKVHRHVNMDYIGVKRYSQEGEIIGEIRFLGLFTSIVYYQDVRLIPIIRKKVMLMEKWSNFLENSHNHKALIAVLQDFPRAELLHIPEKELFKSCMGILSLSVRVEVKLFVHTDSVGNFIRIIIFVPRAQFSTALWLRMQKLLADVYDGKVVNEQMRDSGLVRLQLILKVKSTKNNVNVEMLEAQLRELARGWKEELRCTLESKYELSVANGLYDVYADAFPVSYREKFKKNAVLYDIARMEKVRKTDEAESDLYYDNDSRYQLKVYVPQRIIQLFDMLPVLENMAMKIKNHYSYIIKISDDFEILIHHFILSLNSDNISPLSEIKEKFELILRKIWKGEVEDDFYNSLVVVCGLGWRDVLLLRAWGSYLKQIRFAYAEDYMQQALFNHTKIVLLLVELFSVRFDPKLFSERTKRDEATRAICDDLEKMLGAIESLAEDRIIRALIEINMAIVRTNYYYNKKYISFKINSRKIQDLPLPKPYFEIYVYSNAFEAIHLRGGKVARGGIRWSDRTEDFRTEVLGLMKAQMPKNTAIVPVGSKGGFIVKASENRDENGILCYKNFLRAMLEITDNINGEKLEHPENIVIYDEEDPYLVVAADKGTATFSDYANSVALEYNFWLGDAFASGGSSGYDHKAMSITSSGAWVATHNHLWVLQRNDKQPLTMVGIGDMAGDVFGNGLLGYKKIKLIMAFNHMHIFVDPHPDVEASFAERQRMFKIVKSKWSDYNRNVISNGGGLFSRSSKFIPISKEMKEVLDIQEDKLDPDSLIRQGLKARVDIIWNGGIGTFIKSSAESNDIVGDKSNDNIRVNGREVRSKIVIEGGNLGCTQLGRIEYARSGGYINTDFIDNSAGVSCSDMEVNIKIALSNAVTDKKITVRQRDKLMSEMQEEVAKIILHNTNFLQARLLVVAKVHTQKSLEQYHRIIKNLEKEGRLNRAVEFISNDEDFARMYVEKSGLSIPEIAVVMAYEKMSLYDQLLISDVPDNQYLSKYLVDYFPKVMRKDFRDEIFQHRLRREIITTQLVNMIINRMGCAFIPGLIEYTGMSIGEVVKIYIAVYHAYKLESIWKSIDALKEKVNVKVYLEIVDDISKFVENIVHWFIRNYPKSIDIQLAITEFSDNIAVITRNITKVLDGKSLEAYSNKLKELLAVGLPEDLSTKIANLQFLLSALPIIQITNNVRFQGKMQIPLLTIAHIYFALGDYLQFTWLMESILKLGADDYWQRLSIRSLLDDLRDQQMSLTEQVVKGITDVDNHFLRAFDDWCIHNQVLLKRYNTFLGELKSLKGLDLSRFIIIIKYLAKMV